MTFDFDNLPGRLGTGSTKWGRYAADVLPMWVADTDFPASPAIQDAIRRRMEHPIFGYAMPTASLRETLVAAMQSRYGWAITPESIVVLPGVVAGFNMALNAELTPGDGVLVQTPMYPPILAAPGHWSMVRQDVPLVPEGDDHVLDLAAFRAAMDRSRAFLFCHPHNPTGRAFTRPELEAMAEACLSRKALIISDEIHCDLLFDGRRHVPIASLSPEVAASTVTLMAASKTYNIAGLKTAFAIVPDAGLRARFQAATRGLVDSVNPFGLAATEAAYRDDGAWHSAVMAYLQANRDHLLSELKRRFPSIRAITPQATFLAWLDCSALSLPGKAQTFFLERGKVAFNPGPDFGPAHDAFVRLNFGCSRATLNEALDRMEAALATL